MVVDRFWKASRNIIGRPWLGLVALSITYHLGLSWRSMRDLCKESSMVLACARGSAKISPSHQSIHPSAAPVSLSSVLPAFGLCG